MSGLRGPVVTAGIDVGSSAVKAVLMAVEEDGSARRLAFIVERLRRRTPEAVARIALEACLVSARLDRERVVYIATTGEGDRVDERTGHFYGMTTHARGAIWLDPEVRGAIDVGALHARAMVFDERSRVTGYRMTSQCASGSGQFLENIARYLGIALEEVGPLSLTSDEPELCSSICAVLAETDVINMVSRGIVAPNIIRGIHQSMAQRYVRLLMSAGAIGPVLVTGGLAADTGLVSALEEAAREQSTRISLRAHPDSVLAGALGAALWGAYRARLMEARAATV